MGLAESGGDAKLKELEPKPSRAVAKFLTFVVAHADGYEFSIGVCLLQTLGLCLDLAEDDAGYCPGTPSFPDQIVTPTNGEEHILFRYHFIFLFLYGGESGI